MDLEDPPLANKRIHLHMAWRQGRVQGSEISNFDLNNQLIQIYPNWSKLIQFYPIYPIWSNLI